MFHSNNSKSYCPWGSFITIFAFINLYSYGWLQLKVILDHPCGSTASLNRMKKCITCKCINRQQDKHWLFFFAKFSSSLPSFFCSFPSDVCIHPCLRFSDQRESQQLHDDGTSPQPAASKIQGKQPPQPQATERIWKPAGTHSTPCVCVCQGGEQVGGVCLVHGARVRRWVTTLARSAPSRFAFWRHFARSLRHLPERTRLRDDEHPLVTRVLHGPCEKISKILITEADLGEEVTYDVSVSTHSIYRCPPHTHTTSTHTHTKKQWASFGL